METNRLKHFCVIYETGNMRKAAELLRISHSGMSKSIKTLEGEIGLKLITAEGRGLAITDAGHRFYPKAQELLKQLDQLVEVTDNLKSQSEIRIGTFEVFSTYLFGILAESEFQDSSFTLSETIPGQLEQALLNHQVDFGITYIPIPSPGIQYTKICSLKMNLYSANKNFNNANIEDLPFSAPVSPIVGSPTTVKGLDGWPDDTQPRNIKYKVEMMETALELCRRGIAIAFIPDFIAKLHNSQVINKHKLHLITLTKKHKAITKQVYIVRRTGTLEDRTMKRIARCLRQNLKPEKNNQ